MSKQKRQTNKCTNNVIARVWGNLPVIVTQQEWGCCVILPFVRMEKPRCVNFLLRGRGLQERIDKNHRQDETALNKGVSLR